MKPTDQTYTNIPWKDGGRDRNGVDCAGLAALWLKEETGLELRPPESGTVTDCEEVLQRHCKAGAPERGDVIFFRDLRTKQVRHVAIHLGEGRLLHTLKGCDSRIENGGYLLNRLGFVHAGVISWRDAPAVSAALADPKMGDAFTVVMFILSVALSAASAFLMPRPKIGQFRNETGRYGFDQLVTQTSSTIPLPDMLGAVIAAGNSPFQSLIDRTQPVSDAAEQKVNKVVVLASGPIEDVEFNSSVIKINGFAYTAPRWHPSGFKLDPAQTKAEAVDGTIGSDAARPSLTVYKGEHAITVPVDVRAQYDRNFPIYGLSGAACLVFRLIDSTKFPQFNLTVNVKARTCRQFDASGFVQTTVTGESLTGADGTKVRFKLANVDIASVTSLSVDAVSYSEISATAQTGNVYRLNQLKGYVEFVAAPANAASITTTYKYHAREWTQNPAMHLVYLLTEKGRGKGFPEAKVNWPAAVALRDFCDEPVNWISSAGPVTGARFQCNYSIDYRKPIQEHIRAVLDACYSVLFASGGRFVMKARKSETSVFSFTSANILADSFSSEKVDRSQRSNRIHLFYHSAETYNAETEVVRDDVANQGDREARIGNDGVVEETLHMPAVDSQAQAERLAETILREDLGARWVVELKTTVKGLALEPCDLVDITHSSQPAWLAKLFRIEELSHDADDRLTLKLSEYVPEAYF